MQGVTRRRILLVDDRPEHVSGLSTLLNLDGYDVIVASGGALAFARVSQQHFDVVFSDLRMPDMSGLELLAEVRDMNPSIPVVIYTQFTTRGTEKAAKLLGAAAYIHGLAIDDVRNTLSEVLDGPQENVGPAARRWTAVVLDVAKTADDVPTISAWALRAGKSLGTLKRCCECCDVSTGHSLDFARGLRICLRWGGRRCDWYNALDILDGRTLAAFLARAGFDERGIVPGVDAYVRSQQFVKRDVLLRTTIAAICRLSHHRLT